MYRVCLIDIDLHTSTLILPKNVLVLNYLSELLRIQSRGAGAQGCDC